MLVFSLTWIEQVETEMWEWVDLMVGNGLDEMKSALTEGTGLMYRMRLCV